MIKMPSEGDRAKSSRFDISKKQEIATLVGFLIDNEIHLWYSAMRSEDEEKRKEYVNMALEVRKKRSRFLKKIIDNEEEEAWCGGKHLLGEWWKSIEVAVKEFSEGNDKAGMEALDDARDLYALFWMLQEVGKKD